MTAISASAPARSSVSPTSRAESASKLWCIVLGHHVDNRAFKRESSHERTCRCGARYLREDRSLTRVRHTLSCFFGHHTYERLTVRDGHNEYVCVQCGHPLVFRDDHDPYRGQARFEKKVRYLCGLFCHRVEAVMSSMCSWV